MSQKIFLRAVKMNLSASLGCELNSVSGRILDLTS